MISRDHRFHGHTSLAAVYRRGQVVRGPLMSLKYAPRRPGQRYRLGVVVSRKVSKSAVVRNRIRRRLYEGVRQEVALFSTPFDLVISVYQEQAAVVATTQLHAQLHELLFRAGVASDGGRAIVKPTGK